MKITNLTRMLVVCLSVISISLYAARAGGSFSRGGGAHMGSRGGAHFSSRSVSMRPHTSASHTSVYRTSRAHVASPRLSTASTTRRQTTVSRQGVTGRRQTTRSALRRTKGRGGRKGYRRRHGYGHRYRRHRYNFWSSYPLAWWPFYTGIDLAFDNSCAVFNDTAYAVTIYTPSTPQLRLPAGEFLYLPCGDIATIVSPRGSITSNTYDNMSITDDGTGLFVD